MKLAFVFPGQGSQEVGMLADAHDAVAETFGEASDALGYDLWSLVQNGPAEQLNQTEFTQPALLTASVALLRQAMAAGCPSPSVVAGHSLGEYSALVAAGVLEFKDAVSLVQQRGQFMQTAVPLGQGGMAAVMGLGDAEVVAICERVSTGDGAQVQAVNFNAPGQVVIAGEQGALDAAIGECQGAGAKRVMPLAVSAPFHSELIRPAAERMQGALEAVAFSQPAAPVMQNVDAALHDNPDDIRRNLVTQMHSPVLWTDSVRNMAAMGVDAIVEFGPGRVLAGLVKRIDKSLKTHNVNSLESANTLNEVLSQ